MNKHYRKQYLALRQEAFEISAAQMDKREAFYKALEDHVVKTGKVPPEYAEDWKVWTQVEHRRSWRTRPFLVRRLMKAAEIMAKNHIEQVEEAQRK